MNHNPGNIVLKEASLISIKTISKTENSKIIASVDIGFLGATMSRVTLSCSQYLYAGICLLSKGYLLKLFNIDYGKEDMQEILTHITPRT